MQIILSVIALLYSFVISANDDMYDNDYFKSFKKSIGADYILQKYHGSEDFDVDGSDLIYTISTAKFAVKYNISVSQNKSQFSYKLLTSPAIRHYALARSKECVNN